MQTNAATWNDRLDALDSTPVVLYSYRIHSSSCLEMRWKRPMGVTLPWFPFRLIHLIHLVSSSLRVFRYSYSPFEKLLSKQFPFLPHFRLRQSHHLSDSNFLHLGEARFSSKIGLAGIAAFPISIACHAPCQSGNFERTSALIFPFFGHLIRSSSTVPSCSTPIVVHFSSQSFHCK